MSNFDTGRHSPARRKERHERRNPYHLTAERTLTRAPEITALVKEIGKTTYKVRVHFSQTSTETMSDKIKRMLDNTADQPLIKPAALC